MAVLMGESSKKEDLSRMIAKASANGSYSTTNFSFCSPGPRRPPFTAHRSLAQ